MAPPTIQNRIFLVGCSRSGTTLLQCLIAAHSQIISFPESKFFEHLIPSHEPRRLQWGLSSRRFHGWITQFCVDMGQPQRANHWSKLPLPIRWQVRQFVRELDAIALESGHTLWLEKTPEHLHALDWIERDIPDVKVIHLVRNGADVVASLWDATRRDRAKWGHDHGTIEQCIQRWTRDVEVARQHLHKPHHHLVRYEALVENPRQIMEELCTFLAIPFEPTMLEDYKTTAKPLMQNRYQNCEPAVTAQIQNANATKFFTLFSEAEQAEIREKLATVDLEALGAIASSSR